MFMFVLKVFEIIINMLKSKEEDLKASVDEIDLDYDFKPDAETPGGPTNVTANNTIGVG